MKMAMDGINKVIANNKKMKQKKHIQLLQINFSQIILGTKA